jgi:hypothetical protein
LRSELLACILKVKSEATMTRLLASASLAISLIAAVTARADEQDPAKAPAVAPPLPGVALPPGYRWILEGGLQAHVEGRDQPPAWLAEKLAKTKVPTVKDARQIAAEKVRPTAHIYDAITMSNVVGIFELGRKVAKFGEEGDLVWVVRFVRKGGVTQELWISSSTGEVRMLLPAKIEE